jgi:anti-anti-sigma factor
MALSETRCFKEGESLILEISGFLNSTTTPKVTQAYTQYRTEVKNVIVHMENVTYIDSTGIGMLLLLLEDFPKAKGLVTLHVGKCNSQVVKSFEVAMLDRLFEIEIIG